MTFSRVAPATSRTLAPGDELDVQIVGAGHCRVRVVSRERQTLTLATLAGHPEAGRITFGAYRNDEGEVVFHIRSRARSSSGIKYVGFLAAGEPMQTNTWTDVVKTVALTFGEGVRGLRPRGDPDDRGRSGGSGAALRAHLPRRGRLTWRPAAPSPTGASAAAGRSPISRAG